MADFHTIRVKEVKKETSDTVSITLDLPSRLRNLFAYKQGQYLTFKKKIDGKEVRRSYSLCSSPHVDEDWQVAIKKVEGGSFSTWANETLKAGDILEVMPPEGNFYTEIESSQKKNYVGFAAGSGITPLMSIIKSTLEIESKSSFTLFYGNRTMDSVIFAEELLQIGEKYGDRFDLNYILSRSEENGILSGRINAEKCDEVESEIPAVYKGDEYFLCGPEEMIFSLKEGLEGKGIDKSKIHFELFNTPVQSAEENTDVIPDIESEVTVLIDGEEHIFNLSSKGDSILDAAMEQGADVPFSCKGAVCCTCRAKVAEGGVRMALNYALTDKEVEDGYVLTCQSHPTTEKVVIDYDQD